jgi:hypothetical protein
MTGAHDPRIAATPEATEFIRANGGRIYVWADSSGLERTALAPPTGLVFRTYHADGFEFFEHEEIATPEVWTLGLHHLPHKHVVANWGGWEPTLRL